MEVVPGVGCQLGRGGQHRAGASSVLREGQQGRRCTYSLAGRRDDRLGPCGALPATLSETLWLPSQGLLARGSPVLNCWLGVVPQFISFSSLGGFTSGALAACPCLWHRPRPSQQASVTLSFGEKGFSVQVFLSGGALTPANLFTLGLATSKSHAQE